MKHNFNAGPVVLPKEAIEATINAIRDFNGTGIGLLEISHRTPGWEKVMVELEQLWRELLNIPANYRVIFLGGGASTQFYNVPMNLLHNKAAYLVTGVWAKKAMQEAKKLGKVEVVADSSDRNFCYVPKGYTIPTDADYFHITTNNTIYGTEIHVDMDSPIPLVADASSDIMSRPMDISKYAVVYGGAQKNVGPAGATFVIIREDVLKKEKGSLPTMTDWRTHFDDADPRNNSMFNTPPVLPLYTMYETLKWVKANGGVEGIYKKNIEKAALLYDEIDRNPLFVGTADKEDRSIMNVCFVMSKGHEEKEDAFFNFAKEKGMVGIKGHRSVGGFRASIYNACPLESVKALVACMQEFEKLHA